MKARHLFTIALGALMLTACHKEDVEISSSAPSIISATMESSTRTTINEDREVLWSTGDVLALIYSPSANVDYTLADGAGTTSGTFATTATAPSGDVVAALYPSSIFSGYANDKIVVTMPDTYTYAENNIAGAPMAALVDDVEDNIAFKNAGALLAATVNNIPAGYNKVILESAAQLTGEFNILFDSNNIPALTSTTTPTEDKITIEFTAAAGANKTFYFPLPVQDFQSLKLSITDGTTPIVLKSAALNAERNGCYRFTYTYATQAASADEATTALASGSSVVEVDLTNESTPTPSITIPESNNEQTSLSFTAIPVGATVEIAATSATAEVSKEVSIVTSANNDENNFVINLPKSTVTLNADADASTPTVYDVVTAKTAANTLIVADNVTINTLYVEGGNVRVSAGGKISSIARTQTNSDAKTYIIVEEGAQIPAELGENIVKISTDEWEAMREAEAALIEAIAAGGEVKLTSNIELTQSVTINNGETVTLDLNGYTINQKLLCSASYNMFTNKGTFIIKDSSSEKSGKISFEELGESGGTAWGSYTIYNYGTLEVFGGTIEHLGSTGEHETNIPIQNYAGKVTIHDGVISSPEFRSLRDFTAGGEIIIYGGKFKGQVWMHGLGNGSTSLTISGGEFEPCYGYDGSSVYITNSSNDVIMNITGGKFNTKIGCAAPDRNGAKGSVSGGIFTDSAKQGTNAVLLAAGKEFVANDDSTFVWAIGDAPVAE